MSVSTGPLAGVKVLELGTLIAGPFAARFMGEFGADVIKIEDPNGGDPLRKWRKLYPEVGGTSLWWAVQARNKKSVTVNLKAPEGKEIVYAKANSEKFPPHSDVYRVSAAGGKAVALTSDHLSEYPLWGPTGKIVFVKLLEGSTRKYAPKNELFLMNPNGKGVKRLTHTKVGQLLQGLFPTAWSANGKRLLAQFGGQDTTYAVGVNVQTGAQKPILEATEQGLVGAALSPNGQTVYGSTGGFEPGGNQAVVSVPWSGGKPKLLVKGASSPSWSS